MSVTMITFCLGFCQILLFVRVLSDRFPVYSVTSCPQNDIEWRKASERLNCSLHYNKKLYRYHCLPDSKLTNLVEFCYDHIRPLVPKGNCVVLNTHSTLLDTYNCSKFKKGCPDVHFDSDAILKYPSCLLIDTKIRCYMAENTCITVSGLNFTAKSIFSEASTTRENKEIHDICLAAIIISIFVVLLTPGVIWFILWIKGRWRKSLSEEEFLLKGELRFEDKSPSSQTVQLGEKVCMRSTVAVVENAMTIIPEDIHFKWTFASSEGEEYKDIQVSDDRRVTCSTKPPNPTLIIRRANKDDKGYYKLTAMDKSKKNKRDLIFYLDVWGFKPTVDIIGGHSVTKGETASFVVLQSSYPEAFRIRWYKVEREDHTDFIKDETCIDITSEKYKGSTFDFLVINDVNNKDGGCYRVKVKNLIGEKSAFVHLFVRDEEKGKHNSSITDEEKFKPTKDLEMDIELDSENINLKKISGVSSEEEKGRIQILTVKEEEKDPITISNVRRVYHISNDTKSGIFWISDGGRLMKIDKQGYLIQVVDVGQFNTGCHSVNNKGELLYLKMEKVINCNVNEENFIDISKTTASCTGKWVAWCIYCSKINDEILIGLHNEEAKGNVHRYDQHGKFKEEIDGENSLCKPLYMTENYNGDIIVSDAGKRAVIGVKKDKEIFQYKRKSAWKIFPTGVCTDKSGCILVCIYEDNESNIHLLSKNGEFLKKMLRKEDCAFGPCAICIVDDLLYLGQESCQDIQVYEINRESN